MIFHSKKINKIPGLKEFFFHKKKWTYLKEFTKV